MGIGELRCRRSRRRKGDENILVCNRRREESSGGLVASVEYTRRVRMRWKRRERIK